MLPESVSVPSKSKAATVGRLGGRFPSAVSSVDRSATTAGTSCEPHRSLERLPAAHDVAAARRLTESGVLLGQPPLLERAIRSERRHT